MQSKLTLKPIKYIEGDIKLPGSKSISNRALLLSALSHGTTHLKNLLDSDDIKYMLKVLKILKIKYKLTNNNTECIIIGNKGPFEILNNKPKKLFFGNAGTAIRPLTAVLSLRKNNFILTGEKRMQERPIGDLVSSLKKGGAKINFLEKENYPPIHIQGNFKGGNININGNLSSQFLTSLLIAAPLTYKDTKISVENELVSKPYIKTTLKLIKIFKGNIENIKYKKFYIKANQKYQSPNEYIIEGDLSSASYFFAAAAINGEITINDINRNSIQGDIAFLDVLKEMGAIIKYQNNSITCTSNVLYGIDIDVNHIPDSAMTIAMVALFAKGKTRLRNIYNWRIKETDRLFAMQKELEKIGAEIKTGRDYIVINPPKKFFHAEINTYNDHRIAMCFSLIAFAETVTILNPECVTKTFPKYFDVLKKLVNFN